MVNFLYASLVTSHSISKSSIFVGILCERLLRTHNKLERNILRKGEFAFFE